MQIVILVLVAWLTVAAILAIGWGHAARLGSGPRPSDAHVRRVVHQAAQVEVERESAA